jgi:uncharacterized protein
MTPKKASAQPARRQSPVPPRQTASAAAQPPTVSGRWLVTAIGLVIVGAAICAWGSLCLIFWQGSWQLLYHPSSAITRTPASDKIPFSDIGFAVSDAGVPRLKGWWIPADSGAHYSRYTALYLHGANGNLSDSVGAVARLHAEGLNVLAFDYRGYGQSQFVHPSEVHWREDAASALQYLTGTRHIPPSSIVLVGSGLGANLALEIAAVHPDLAGIVLEEPRNAPEEVVFNDPRARLVPAHWLVSDRWGLNEPAARLLIPSLWLYWNVGQGDSAPPEQPESFQKVTSPKMLVWLPAAQNANSDFANALSRWLDDLPEKGHNLPASWTPG